jgi:uncharacterized lipoprotein YbaY
MKRSAIISSIVLVAVLLLSACGGVGSEEVVTSTVSGNVIADGEVSLPVSAVLDVSLVDWAKADAQPDSPIQSKTIGTFSKPLQGQQLPETFEIAYNQADIAYDHVYTVQASIRTPENGILFITTELYPVITQTSPTSGLELTVHPVTPAEPTTDGDAQNGQEPSATPTEDQGEVSQPTPTLTATSEPTATELPPTATQAPLPTSPPDDPALELGTPTFKDSFSKNSGNWTLFDSDCFQSEIIDGKYVMTGKGAGYMCWEFTWPKVKNFYLEATVKPVDECPEGNAYGMIFRSPDNNAGYVYALTCEGQYYLWAWDGENGSTLLRPTNSTQIRPGANQENRIGVMAVGKAFDLYINGVLQTRVNNEMFLDRGKFGTAILALDGQPFTVYFDDMKMWELP